MVDKSEFAIATSQAQNPILFKLNYYSIYCLKLLLYLPLSLQVSPWADYLIYTFPVPHKTMSTTAIALTGDTIQIQHT